LWKNTIYRKFLLARFTLELKSSMPFLEKSCITRRIAFWIVILLVWTASASAGEWYGSYGSPPNSFVVQGDGIGVGLKAGDALFQIVHGGQSTQSEVVESSSSCLIRIKDYRDLTCNNGGGPWPCITAIYFRCLSGTHRVTGCRCASAADPVNGPRSSDASNPQTCKPVEFSTGVKLGRYVDYSSGGGNPLQFIRYYTSNTKTSALSGDFDVGLLGRGGWLSDFDAKLTFQGWTAGSSTPPGNNDKVLMQLPEGGQMAWIYQSTPNSWVPAYVSYAASGSIVIGAAGNGRKGIANMSYSSGQFFARMKDDRTFVFSNMGVT
jgi:hypothetical protein